VFIFKFVFFVIFFIQDSSSLDLKHDSEGGDNDTSVVHSNSVQSFKRPSGNKVSTSSLSQSGQRRSSSRERFSDVRSQYIFYVIHF